MKAKACSWRDIRLIRYISPAYQSSKRACQGETGLQTSPQTVCREKLS